MPVVTAVSVSPTCAVPVMVGAPVGVPAAAVTVPDEGYAALVRISTPLSSSVKLTLTLILLPTSSSVRV